MKSNRYNPDYRRSSRQREEYHDKPKTNNSYDDDYFDSYRDEANPPFGSSSYDRAHDWWNNRSGQRYGGRGSEDFTSHGRIHQYNQDFGRPGNYLYPEEQHRRRNERTGDLWQEELYTGVHHPVEHYRNTTQGNHRGKGPRNYVRSDERIKEDINDRLYDDAFVDATDIEVAVTSGDVVLTGSVDSRMAKRRAEDICDAVSGVKNIENRIKVTQANQSSYGDNSDRVVGPERSNISQQMQ